MTGRRVVGHLVTVARQAAEGVVEQPSCRTRVAWRHAGEATERCTASFRSGVG